MAAVVHLNRQPEQRIIQGFSQSELLNLTSCCKRSNQVLAETIQAQMVSYHISDCVTFGAWSYPYIHAIGGLGLEYAWWDIRINEELTSIILCKQGSNIELSSFYGHLSDTFEVKVISYFLDTSVAQVDTCQLRVRLAGLKVISFWDTSVAWADTYQLRVRPTSIFKYIFWTPMVYLHHLDTSNRPYELRVRPTSIFKDYYLDTAVSGHLPVVGVLHTWMAAQYGNHGHLRYRSLRVAGATYCKYP